MNGHILNPNKNVNIVESATCVFHSMLKKGNIKKQKKVQTPHPWIRLIRRKHATLKKTIFQTKMQKCRNCFYVRVRGKYKLSGNLSVLKMFICIFMFWLIIFIILFILLIYSFTSNTLNFKAIFAWMCLVSGFTYLPLT